MWHRALRKTSHLLRALARIVPDDSENAHMTYYALDLEKRELERTLGALASSELGAELQSKIDTKGLCATYDDGLEFIQDGGLQGRTRLERISTEAREQYSIERLAMRDSSPSASESSRSGDTEATPPSTPGAEDRLPFHLLFLGSSLGNFGRGEDVAFLRNLPLQPGSGNTLLLGLDHDNERGKIERAYDDSKGATRAFILNGLSVAGRTLGDEGLFETGKWQYVGRYNAELRMCFSYVTTFEDSDDGQADTRRSTSQRRTRPSSTRLPAPRLSSSRTSSSKWRCRTRFVSPSLFAHPL